MVTLNDVTVEASDEAAEVSMCADSRNPSWADIGSSSSGDGQSPEIVPYF